MSFQPPRNLLQGIGQGISQFGNTLAQFFLQRDAQRREAGRSAQDEARQRIAELDNQIAQAQQLGRTDVIPVLQQEREFLAQVENAPEMQAEQMLRQAREQQSVVQERPSPGVDTTLPQLFGRSTIQPTGVASARATGTIAGAQEEQELQEQIAAEQRQRENLLAAEEARFGFNLQLQNAELGAIAEREATETANENREALIQRLTDAETVIRDFNPASGNLALIDQARLALRSAGSGLAGQPLQEAIAGVSVAIPSAEGPTGGATLSVEGILARVESEANALSRRGESRQQARERALTRFEEFAGDTSLDATEKARTLEEALNHPFLDEQDKRHILAIAGIVNENEVQAALSAVTRLDLENQLMRLGLAEGRVRLASAMTALERERFEFGEVQRAADVNFELLQTAAAKAQQDLINEGRLAEQDVAQWNLDRYLQFGVLPTDPGQLRALADNFQIKEDELRKRAQERWEQVQRVEELSIQLDEQKLRIGDRELEVIDLSMERDKLAIRMLEWEHERSQEIALQDNEDRFAEKLEMAMNAGDTAWIAQQMANPDNVSVMPQLTRAYAIAHELDDLNGLSRAAARAQFRADLDRIANNVFVDRTETIKAMANTMTPEEIDVWIEEHPADARRLGNTFIASARTLSGHSVHLESMEDPARLQAYEQLLALTSSAFPVGEIETKGIPALEELMTAAGITDELTREGFIAATRQFWRNTDDEFARDLVIFELTKIDILDGIETRAKELGLREQELQARLAEAAARASRGESAGNLGGALSSEARLTLEAMQDSVESNIESIRQQQIDGGCISEDPGDPLATPTPVDPGKCQTLELEMEVAQQMLRSIPLFNPIGQQIAPGIVSDIMDDLSNRAAIDAENQRLANLHEAFPDARNFSPEEQQRAAQELEVNPSFELPFSPAAIGRSGGEATQLFSIANAFLASAQSSNLQESLESRINQIAQRRSRWNHENIVRYLESQNYGGNRSFDRSMLSEGFRNAFLGDPLGLEQSFGQ